VQVRSCTTIIQSGRETLANLAIALNNRGLAYHANGQVDLAIHDFDQAIRSTPDDAELYTNRAAQ
jgi:Flp pilus assembly protein TadD